MEMDMQIPMEMDMQIPAGGDERSSNTYTYSYIHNSKRVGATKRDEEDSDRRNNNRWGRGRGQSPKKIQRQCSFWLAGNCKHAGGDCKYLHSHVIGGSELTFLTKLAGHDNKPIRGIAFPSYSATPKLYSASAGQDKKLIAWDCHTGHGTHIPLGGGDEVGCLLAEGPWVFVGLHNAVRAWNTLMSTDLSLDGPKGQVRALAVANQMLLAGTQDGTVLVWKFNVADNTFEPAASLSGHTLPIVSLISGADRLYFASMDHTIRVWDLGTFQCIQTLRGHTSVVMSLLCWDQFLLTCSLDCTVKVWCATSSGALEVIYTHNEEYVWDLGSSQYIQIVRDHTSIAIPLL